jgi:8-oxo-dGTP pyrophosphatase MutT (NUDIX family)
MNNDVMTKKSLLQKLDAYSPRTQLEEEQARNRAAVLIPIVAEPEPSLILTLRASHMDSHAGEVAWPGGKQDPEDVSLQATALRETHEEIGLHPEHVNVVAELRPFISKFGLLVTPFVGLIEAPRELKANPHEIDSIFHVPLSWLEDDPRTQTDIISRHGETMKVPVYEYEGFRIWGLTSMILWEFMREVMEVSLEKESCDKLLKNAAKDWETR